MAGCVVSGWTACLKYAVAEDDLPLAVNRICSLYVVSYFSQLHCRSDFIGIEWKGDFILIAH